MYNKISNTTGGCNLGYSLHPGNAVKDLALQATLPSPEPVPYPIAKTEVH